MTTTDTTDRQVRTGDDWTTRTGRDGTVTNVTTNGQWTEVEWETTDGQSGVTTVRNRDW